VNNCIFYVSQNALQTLLSIASTPLTLNVHRDVLTDISLHWPTSVYSHTLLHSHVQNYPYGFFCVQD